jgi:hypothetical protein
MSYLLVISISLIFLFLWSRLPDPTGPQPETRNSLPDRESNAMQSAKTGETRGPKLHPDRLGRPDDDGGIRLFPHGDVQGRADGREAVTASALRSVQGVLRGDRHVPGARQGARHNYLQRAVRYDHFQRDDRLEKTIATQGRGETMNCPRCGNDQWGTSRDSFGCEDMVCINCGLLGQPAIDALVHDWVTNHAPPETTLQAVPDFPSAQRYLP